jgi:hypothetical protein
LVISKKQAPIGATLLPAPAEALPAVPDPRIPSFGGIVPRPHIDYAKYMDKIEPIFQFLD